MLRLPSRPRLLCGLLLFALAAPALAQQPVSNVVVDSNPAVFAVLTALNVAGYKTGLGPSTPIRNAVLAQIQAHPSPAVAELRRYYTAHRTANSAQDLARFVTLSLFLGNPPGLSLTVPATALPPEAESVSDILPLVRDLWVQSNLEAIWQSVQPQYTAALQADAAPLRAMLTQVDAYFRMPHAYGARQYFIYPDAMIASGESDALNYEDNYYLVANLHLPPEMRQVRHTYLHFLLDPLIAQYPGAIAPVDQRILPLVARAPALDPQFKHNATLLYTECLVRAVEIQLDLATPAEQDAAVQAAMRQGLVLTAFWNGQLQKFRADPAGFEQFYPLAAFAIPIETLTGAVRHLQFAAAPVSPAAVAETAAPEPIRAPSTLDLAQQRFDAHDLSAASTLATTALQQSATDHASAYYLLGKIAALRNQPQAALDNFQKTLAAAQPGQHHLRTWANIYLARLYDAEHDRAQAVAHYKAALATVDTPATKSLVEAGVKAPFLPPGAKN